MRLLLVELQLQGFAAIPRLVDCFDFLQGQRRGRQMHGPAIAVFIIFALPHQLSFHSGQGMRIVGPPDNLFGHTKHSP